MNCTTHYACDCISAHRIELGNEVQRLKSALKECATAMQSVSLDAVLCRDGHGPVQYYITEWAYERNRKALGQIEEMIKE